MTAYNSCEPIVSSGGEWGGGLRTGGLLLVKPHYVFASISLGLSPCLRVTLTFVLHVNEVTPALKYGQLCFTSSPTAEVILEGRGGDRGSAQTQAWGLCLKILRILFLDIELAQEQWHRQMGEFYCPGL